MNLLTMLAIVSATLAVFMTACGPATNTTPGPVELAEMGAEMVVGGRTHLVMEVSSHALDQDRTAGIEFAAAVFSNLTGDHLDYH